MACYNHVNDKYTCICFTIIVVKQNEIMGKEITKIILNSRLKYGYLRLENRFKDKDLPVLVLFSTYYVSGLPFYSA